MSRTVERMFDRSLPNPGTLRDVDDATLIDAVRGWERAAAAAEARKLAAVAELIRRRCTDEHPDWACDDWDATAAELSAALNTGHGRACGQMDLAVSLRDRLPRVGALFLAGELTARTVKLIADRTYLVTDEQALAQLDAAIADRAVAWGPLSDYKLTQALDVWVDQIDPGAVRRTRTNSRNRDLTVGDPDEKSGTTAVWGRLLSTDAALLDGRLKAMVHAVCDDDPRTLAQRRADALGALAAGTTHLACQCGAPTCGANTDDGRASSVMVHVVAEEASLHTEPDSMVHGEGVPPDTQPEPTPQPRRKAGLILGGGIVPAPLLAELIAHGATVKPVVTPGPAPEPRYRPSTGLATFVRTRDITCRFPGCDRPAVGADIDHTIAYPGGATHAGNTKISCRKHHLLKTFWPGWSDEQLADGTVIVTTPTGHTYTTKPGSMLLFPTWNTTTPSPPHRAAEPETSEARTLMMPKRKQTRAQARAYRIKTERALNDAHVAERNIPPPI